MVDSYEAEMTQKLSLQFPEFIVKFIDYDEDTGTMSLEKLTPFYDAEDIDSERVARSLIDAIETLHEHGYVHRDIALDNIGFRDNNFEQVVLFDLASVQTMEGPDTNVLGHHYSDEYEELLENASNDEERFILIKDNDHYALHEVLREMGVK